MTTPTITSGAAPGPDCAVSKQREDHGGERQLQDGHDGRAEPDGDRGREVEARQVRGHHARRRAEEQRGERRPAAEARERDRPRERPCTRAAARARRATSSPRRSAAPGAAPGPRTARRSAACPPARRRRSPARPPCRPASGSAKNGRGVTHRLQAAGEREDGERPERDRSGQRHRPQEVDHVRAVKGRQRHRLRSRSPRR